MGRSFATCKAAIIPSAMVPSALRVGLLSLASLPQPMSHTCLLWPQSDQRAPVLETQAPIPHSSPKSFPSDSSLLL